MLERGQLRSQKLDALYLKLEGFLIHRLVPSQLAFDAAHIKRPFVEVTHLLVNGVGPTFERAAYTGMQVSASGLANEDHVLTPERRGHHLRDEHRDEQLVDR